MSRKQRPIRAFFQKFLRYFELNLVNFYTFLQLHESNLFTKGLFSWVGFKFKFLKYQGHLRVAGKSDWSLHSLFEYSLEAIVNFLMYHYELQPILVEFLVS